MFWILIIIIISFAISPFSTIVHLFLLRQLLVSQQSFSSFHAMLSNIHARRKLVVFVFCFLSCMIFQLGRTIFSVSNFFYFPFITSSLSYFVEQRNFFHENLRWREDDGDTETECWEENEEVELVQPSQPSLLINIRKTKRDFTMFLWTWKLKSEAAEEKVEIVGWKKFRVECYKSWVLNLNVLCEKRKSKSASG